MDHYNEAEKMKKRLIYIAGAVLIIIIVGVVALIGNYNTHRKETYYDPGSGETISNPINKSPEVAGGNPHAPVYLGFKKLVDVGLSQYQQQGLMKSLEDYSSKHDNALKEVSITANSIKTNLADPTKPNDRDNVTFELTFNRNQKVNAKLEYFDISAIQLYLYAQDSGQNLYTSDVVDTFQSPTP
jgi:hypothetical protein